MVRALISWSLHNRFIVLLGTLGLIVIGIYSARNLNVEAYPDPTPPLVEVITQNPGASPEEMERLIGIPLETALNGMPGLKYLRSISLAGLTDIKCQFEYGTDYWAARQEVINRIGMVNNLPQGVTPGLSPWSPIGEIVRYVLEGPGYTLNQLKAVQDWVLTRAFKTVPGVIDVTGFGGTVKQYQVLLDTQLMRRYDVTLQMVTDAIAKSNANVGGNILPLGPQSHNVRAIGLIGEGDDSLDPAVADRAYAIEVEKLEDIQDVVVTTYNNMPVYIRQIAKVVIGYQPRLGVVGRNGENDVVEGIVLMRKYEKSMPTSEAVAEEDRRAQQGQPPAQGDEDRPVQPPDRPGQRDDAQRRPQPRRRHGPGDPDPLRLPGRHHQRRDRGPDDPAGAVVLGDGAVPPGEVGQPAVDRRRGLRDHRGQLGDHRREHLPAHHGQDADRSRPLIERIIEASHEIERALFFSTLIIVCAFIPLFSMTGPEGALFGPMANTYAFAICGRPDAGGDADPGPLLLPLPQQAGGEGDVHRPDHEAAIT